MKTNQLLALAGVAAWFWIGADNASAQPGGGFPGGGPGGRPAFNMADMQKSVVESFRTDFDVKDDAEWKVIGDSLQKVLDAQIAVQTGGGLTALYARVVMRNFGVTNAFNGANGQGGNGQGGRRRMGGMNALMGTPDPDVAALQKLIDENGTPAQLSAAVKKCLDARKARQAKLTQAQDNLRNLLTPRQEAVAVAAGLL